MSEGLVEPKSLPIVWGAFASSQLLFGAVGWTMWPGPDPAQSTLVWALGILIVPLSFLSAVGVPMLVRGAEQHATRFLLRWATAEAASLMGLVGAFLGGPRWFAVAAAAWGFLMILLAYPSQPDG